MWRRKNWNRLNEMLDEGIRGEFTESRYDSSVSEIRPKASQKRMKVRVICPNPFPLLFDKKWTAEALYNILDNAVKYSPPASEITLSARSYEMYGAVSVKDCGIGLYLAREILRKQEFAMLEAVGMTGKQLQQMLMWEGAYHALFTVALSVLAGSIISIAGLRPVGLNFFFFTWKFTVGPIILCTPVIFLVVLLVPVLGYRRLCRTSVVERIRTAE